MADDTVKFHAGERASVEHLVAAYKETVSDLDPWISQQRDNYNIRHCLWNNQTDDGRKHGTDDNPAFPWEGASDLRTFVVDQLITSDIALLCTSLSKAQLAAVPVESSDQARSRLVSSFMRWMMFSQMDEIGHESELLASYYLEKGIGALGVFWETKLVTRQREFAMSDIEKLAPDLAEVLREDAVDEKAASEYLLTVMPKLTPRKASRMVKQLRSSGVTTVGIPEVDEQRPVIRAFSLDNDLLLPPGTTDVQKAPYLFMRTWYTPDQLRSKVITDQWDRKFVERVIETQSQNGGDFDIAQGREWESRYGIEGNQRTENICLVCAYYRTNDEDGIAETHYTIFHPEISDIYAKHDKLDYRPARYPFVVFQRERLSRRMLETRGYPEIARGWQEQIKIERDTRIDRASLSTNPPFLYPIGRQPTAWGPGAKVPYRRRDDYGWAEIPSFDQGSIEIEQNLVRTANKYFGRETGDEDKADASLVRRFMVQKWLACWKMVFRQVWSLYKQYGPDEQFFRVVGVGNRQEMMVKGDEHEKFDFYLDFDVPGIDPEYQLKKLESIAKMAMGYDRTGRTDWSALYGEIVAGIDPVVSERILIPQEEASEKEAADEKELLTQIASGMDVDLQPPFNAQIRRQVFQEYLQGSEAIPATDVQQRLQGDEAFAKRIQKHEQQIRMQEMQQDNAQIGRTGAAPGNL